MKKLKSARGETLIETLAAMLVIVLGMTILAGAIVTSARLNRRAASDNIITFADMSTASGTKSSVKIQIADGPEQTAEVTVYTSAAKEGSASAKKLYFYE